MNREVWFPDIESGIGRVRERGAGRLRVVSWVLMAVVLVGAVGYSLTDDDQPITNAERSAALARTIACPQCMGQSVAQSDASIAEVIRGEIARQVDAGLSDAQIRQVYVERYGDWVNLKPLRSGFTSFVWIAPFLAIGAAVGGLGLAFARWRDKLAPADLDPEARAAALSSRSVMAREAKRMETRLDPDALAALEDERAFLATSLADLDAEHRVGDLSDADYETLREDYSRRAAEVASAAEQGRRALGGVPRVTSREVVTWVVGLALVGTIAGVAVAQASGSRLEGETASGDVRTSTRTKLLQAEELLADRDSWDDAIALYDEVLDEQPSNAPALTYRGWLRYRAGATLADVAPDWDQAVASDPEYPDVRVFRSIALRDDGQLGAAGDELDVFDALDPPAALQSLVGPLRHDVAVADADALYDAIPAGTEPITVDSLDISALRALGAANALLEDPRADAVLKAIKIYDGVREAQPGNPEATLGLAYGFFVAQLFDQAQGYLDEFRALGAAVPPVLAADADRLADELARVADS